MSKTKATNYSVPLITMTSLFFMIGFITCMNDVLIPYLKGVFALSHFQSNLVQLAFFMAYFIISLIYFIISITKGDPILKVGYKKTIVAGFFTSGLACLLFFYEAGLSTPTFGMFLTALFMLGSGFTLLQIAANPLVSLLGTPETASSRLTLSQAFNSMGTTIAPAIGGFLIFFVFKNLEGAAAVRIPYLGLACILFLLGVLILISNIPDVTDSEKQEEMPRGGLMSGALRYPQLVGGMFGIFCYVGGEVTIGSNLVSFMKETFSINESIASSLLSFYWGGAMIGRFMGSFSMSKMNNTNKYVLMAVSAILCFALIVGINYIINYMTGGKTYFTNEDLITFFGFMVLNYIAFIVSKSSPSRTVGLFAVSNVILLIIMLCTNSSISMWSILAVGLFNSIMFPTIFTLAIDGLGIHTSQGSSLLVMMILGGALFPPIQGFIADNSNTHIAFFLPIICYAYIAWYGFIGSKMRLKE